MDFRFNRRNLAPYDDESDDSSVDSSSDSTDLSSLGEVDNSPIQIRNLLRLAQNSNSSSSSNNTPLMNKYRDFLANNAPDPNQYKPGFGRKLIAGLASLGTSPREALMVQDQILNAPYNRAMTSYYSRAKALGTGAGIEERELGIQQRARYGEERLQQLDEQNRIRQQLADTQYQKERDIYETKNRDHELKVQALQQALDKANADRDERARQANQRSDDVNRRIAAVEAENKARDAKRELDSALAQKKFDDQAALHAAQIKKYQDDTANAQHRAQIAEEALKQKSEPKTTTSVETKPSNIFQRVFGITPDSKTKTTTTQQGKSSDNTDIKPPAGAKSGGKWVALPSGKQVYQEP